MVVPAVPLLARYLPVLAIFAASVAICGAPAQFPEPLPRDRSPLAEAHLRKRLDVWKTRLKLADWHIAIRMAHHSELRQGTLGNIRWDAGTKKATIRVLHASDYRASYEATLRDMEFTVVHELLHLVLSSLPRSEASRSDEEHAVNSMTDALLELDRKPPANTVH